MSKKKKLSRAQIARIAKKALAELAETRLELYMSAYDEEPRNWEGADADRVRADVLEGTWRFLHPALTDFYISPRRNIL